MDAHFWARVAGYALLFAVLIGPVAGLYLTRPPWRFLGYGFSGVDLLSFGGSTSE